MQHVTHVRYERTVPTVPAYPRSSPLAPVPYYSVTLSSLGGLAAASDLEEESTLGISHFDEPAAELYGFKRRKFVKDSQKSLFRVPSA